jgi:hypothetical protein
MTLTDLSHLARPDIHLNPDDTWAEYRNIVERAIDNTPRSLQTRIGPSEIGNPCDACLINKLAGTPERREPGTSWLPFIGTRVPRRNHRLSRSSRRRRHHRSRRPVRHPHR